MCERSAQRHCRDRVKRSGLSIYSGALTRRDHHVCERSIPVAGHWSRASFVLACSIPACELNRNCRQSVKLLRTGKTARLAHKLGLIRFCTPVRPSWLILAPLHDLLDTRFDLLSSLFGMPSSIDAASHAGDDSNEVIHQVMIGIGRKHHLDPPSLHLHQLLNVGKAETG